MAALKALRTPKAALYVRVSTLYQIDKDSLPFQRQELINMAQYVLNINSYEIFEDAGYSGKNTERPAYKQMMSRIRNGEFSHLCVWKIDRISRNLLDFAEMYEELKKYRVTFVSKNEQFDTSSAMGEAMLKIILVFAELERKITSERVTSIMLDRATKGLWNGARMPLGYCWNEKNKFPSIDPTEAITVHFIYDKYEETKSSLQLSRILNNNGIKTKRGGQWSSKTVSDIIRNPFYKGTYRYNYRESARGEIKNEDEWIIIPDNHHGIIDVEQWERCNQIMDHNGINKNVSNSHYRKHTHIFAGLLKCSHCGSGFSANADRTRSSGWRPSNYRCTLLSHMKACGAKHISDVVLGPFIFNYIANFVRLQRKKGPFTLKSIEEDLLTGSCFDDVAAIAPISLSETLLALKGSSKSATHSLYEPNLLASSQNTGDAENINLEILKQEHEKLKTAIQRLTDLYLFDPNALTTQEYVSKKNELEAKLSSIENSLEEKNVFGQVDDVQDISFIRKASAFIVGQKLLNAGEIDFPELALNCDSEILKDLINATINQISVKDGKIESITFKSGLVHHFIYKETVELPICDKCGGRIGSTIGCRTRTFTYQGQKYKRIQVGGIGDTYEKEKNSICQGCSSHSGRWHHWGCELEVCPICGKALATCGHGKE